MQELKHLLLILNLSPICYSSILVKYLSDIYNLSLILESNHIGNTGVEILAENLKYIRNLQSLELGIYIYISSFRLNGDGRNGNRSTI